MHQLPPTANVLAQNPVVRDAIEEAWTDSFPHDEQLRHEEGGWIFLEIATGLLQVVRATRGKQDAINLLNPPVRSGAVIVGIFHTHPNPSSEGWDPGPSPDDIVIDDVLGVPDIIRADNGLHYSGPDSRRGGLGGNPGYP